MTTAADVIAALNQRRLLKRGQHDAPGEFPPAWSHWLDAAPLRKHQIERARAPEWVAQLSQRLRYAGAGASARGEPFFRMRQQARPHDPREGRALRIGVGVVDIAMHMLLAGLLLWLMYLRFLADAQRQEEEAQGEVIQVEFIGIGHREAGGGALANAGAASATAAAASRKAVPAPTSTAADAPSEAAVPVLDQQQLPPPPRMAASSETPAPVVVAPPPELTAAQPLQVTEVPPSQPVAQFRLPPPRERRVDAPEVRLRDVPLQQQVEQVATLKANPVRALQPVQRQAQLHTPELRQQVETLETFHPDATLLARERTAPAAMAASASVRSPQLRGDVRELPLKAGGGTPSPASSGHGTAAQGQSATPGTGVASRADGGGQVAAGSGQGAKAAVQGGRGVGPVGQGAGPGLKPAPGGWPGAAKSDDWGASSRNVAGTGNGNGQSPGGTSGLFNSDGSARLPDAWSKGTNVDLDRAGTWLKRPGLEYRGTRFEQYWIPQGTLLQEWVRRGIKELSIPIPGTKLKLKCVVSLVAVGGGCIPVNPDVNEQSSTGRKAPDIPFKPHLQEDNGSIRPAEAPAAPAAAPSDSAETVEPPVPGG